MGFQYSDEVLDHFMNPRNVGELADANGIGQVGNPTCGDIMKIWLKVDENGTIVEVKFKTFGCASAIASSSIATEMIKGRNIRDARALTNQAIADALGGLPEAKLHCSVLAAEAINKAIDDYEGIERKGRNKVICVCNNVTLGEIEEAISHGAFTLKQISKSTGAMAGACKGLRCEPLITEILSRYQVELTDGKSREGGTE